MAGKSHISPYRWLFIALLVVGAFGVFALLSQGLLSRPTHGAGKDAAGVYAADTPLAEMPDALHPGYILLSVEDLVAVPDIDGFEWPCGEPNGAFMYDAQPFGTDNPKRGGLHTGADLNGIGGENTDEGQPVRAAARGLVVYCGRPSEDWGNVVVLAHRLPGSDRVVQTFYAHLKDMAVRRGSIVPRGQRIGSIGTAEGHYLAHLHFEAIESRCTEAGMPGYRKDGPGNRLDPEQLIAQYPAPAVPDVYASVKRRRVRAWSSPSPIPSTGAPLPEGAIPVNPSQYSIP